MSVGDLYAQFVVAHGLEREGLFALLASEFAPATVLYPGCFLHVTPSFWLPHVVYVDRHARAIDVFADGSGVQQLVRARKRYRAPAHVEFIAHDYTQRLPLRPASFDLLLSLYAPEVTRHCLAYVRSGGIVLSNNHRGDAEHALADRRLELVAVVHERRDAFRLLRDDLTGYLEQRPLAAYRGRQVRGQPLYVRSADYYVFRRRRD